MEQALLFALIFVLAGIVKGITGMGLPTIAMGLLSVIVSPVTAASLLLLPSLLTNLAQGLQGASLPTLMKRLRWLLLAIVLFAAAATSVMTNAQADGIKTALGALLICYAGFSLVGLSFEIATRHEIWLSPLIGLITGLLTGATGIFVVPAVPYLQALKLEREQLVQALGLAFTASTIGLWAGLFAHGALILENTLLSALAILPALAGMYLGRLLRMRMNPVIFRTFFLISLMILGTYMIIR
jgi:uncharacterized membrane protein YfcA